MADGGADVVAGEVGVLELCEGDEAVGDVEEDGFAGAGDRGVSPFG